MTSAADIIREFEQLKTVRQPHENTIRDCYDHSYPQRASGFQQQNSLTHQQASDRKARLVDSTATDAVRIYASSMQAGLTPPSALWAKIDVPHASDQEQRWLDDVSDQLHQEIHASNFDAEAFDAMLDYTIAGWFPLLADTDPNVGGYVFQAWPTGQTYVASTREDGRIDVAYRLYSLTAQQVTNLAAERGGQVSETVRGKLKNEPNAMVQMIYCIRPRNDYIAGSQRSKLLPFGAYQVEYETKTLVAESGFNEFPLLVPRYMRLPDSAYAIGPMFEVLPDARMVNEMKRLDLTAAEVAISGMWIAKDDGVLNPKTVTVGPRKIIVANDVDSMKRLETGNDWQLADERIAQTQQSIRKGLLADQLQPPGSSPAVTATEIHARVALLRQQLGPAFGRLQTEYLAPLITRCFLMGMRAGIFPPPPTSLGNRVFSVRFISPIARAQTLEDVTAIEQQVTDVLQIQPIRPDVVDNYDWDEMQRVLAKARGVPQRIMRDAKDMEKMRNARLQQQQQAQQDAQDQQIKQLATQQMVKQSGAMQ